MLKRRYWRKVENRVIVASNRTCINFPKRDIDKFYGKGNRRTFQKDIAVLVERGFVIVHSRKNERKPNNYELSADWKFWTEKPP